MTEATALRSGPADRLNRAFDRSVGLHIRIGSHMLHSWRVFSLAAFGAATVVWVGIGLVGDLPVAALVLPPVLSVSIFSVHRRHVLRSRGPVRFIFHRHLFISALVTLPLLALLGALSWRVLDDGGARGPGRAGRRARGLPARRMLRRPARGGRSAVRVARGGRAPRPRPGPRRRGLPGVRGGRARPAAFGRGGRGRGGRRLRRLLRRPVLPRRAARRAGADWAAGQRRSGSRSSSLRSGRGSARAHRFPLTLTRMRAEGLEPPSRFRHRHLKPARLPVPPRPRCGYLNCLS